MRRDLKPGPPDRPRRFVRFLTTVRQLRVYCRYDFVIQGVQNSAVQLSAHCELSSQVALSVCSVLHRHPVSTCDTDFSQLPDYKTLNYNYTDRETLDVVRETFVSSDALDKWMHCSKSAISCCEHMDNTTVYTGTVIRVRNNATGA